MNAKMSVVIFILLSFFNIGAITNEVVNNKNSFDYLEKDVRSISEFVENGAKLQYQTKDNIEVENHRIISCLAKEVNGNYEETQKGQFEIVNKDFDINIKSWCEDKYTYVEITMLNKNSQYTTKDLKDILERLENKESKNVQYFLYYEGNGVSLDNNESIKKFIDGNYIKNVQLLNINNGCTGTGYLYDGSKVNFALSKYNTGSHIIIGTPIVFATY